MENVCRLCARQSQSLESVFSFQNGGRLLTDLVAIICPIRIDVNDNLPKQICEECLEIVVSASKLRETSVKSDLNFRSGKFVISQEAPKSSTKIKQEKSADEIIDEDPLTSLNSYFETHSDDNWEDDESRDTTESFTAKKKPIKTRKPVRTSENQFRWPCPSDCGKSFSFQTNVNRHVRRFHDPELLLLPCSMCTFRFKSQQKLKNHLIRAHVDDEVSKKEENQQQSGTSESCDICGDQLSKEYAPVHRKRIHKEEQNKNTKFFECDLCGREYMLKENIELHFNTCHLNKPEKDVAKLKVSKATVFHCDICFKEFSFIGNMYRHKNRFHSTVNAYPCKLCTDRCKTLRMLKLHHERFHENQDFVQTQGMKPEKGIVTTGQCQFCGADFHGLKRRLEAHLLRKHCDELEEVLECEMCHKKFAFAETLRVHIQTHNKKIKTQSYPHCCDTCGRRFLNEESLRKHLESHKTESAVACHICGKLMSSSTALEYHIRRHKEQKEFPCPQCPAQFVSSSELDRHVVTHETQRPFTCDLCPMSFKIHDILKKHMKRIHYKTMERKHDCDFCHKKFYTLYSLERHVRIHTGEKPFKCQFCDSSYTQKGDCLKHMQRVHVGDALYSCSMDECTATFRLKSELTDHYKIHYEGRD